MRPHYLKLISQRLLWLESGPLFVSLRVVFSLIVTTLLIVSLLVIWPLDVIRRKGLALVLMLAEYVQSILKLEEAK